MKVDIVLNLWDGFMNKTIGVEASNEDNLCVSVARSLIGHGISFDVTCNECDGNGVIRCGECEGLGHIVEDCNECDGRGYDYLGPCKTCDGVGCDECLMSGRERRDCDACDDGGVQHVCDECNETGDLRCPTCLGAFSGSHTITADHFRKALEGIGESQGGSQ